MPYCPVNPQHTDADGWVDPASDKWKGVCWDGSAPRMAPVSSQASQPVADAPATNPSVQAQGGRYPTPSYDAAGPGAFFPLPPNAGSRVPPVVAPLPESFTHLKDYYSPTPSQYGYYKPSQLEGAFDALAPSDQQLFSLVADATSGTPRGLFGRLVKEAARQNINGGTVSPFDLLRNMAQRNGVLDQFNNVVATNPTAAGGTAGGSGGGYSGPVSRVTHMNEADLRLLTDTVASTVLGRAVTKQEFAQITQKVRAAETQNPDVASGGGAMTTAISGLSAGGRQDVITRALLQQDGAKEFTMATKFMDLFNKALQERPDAAA